jgi:GNAT superfamily N-acetyltransferase
MKIVDPESDQLSLYFRCLEDWSDETTEAGPQKEMWYHKMKDKGLRVKFALDDQGVVGGMIQYVPIEYSSAEGKDLYFINCIWVHGHKQGRGDFQGKGMGKALLHAAEADARSLGVKGIAAWGLILPFWMRGAWFRKQGYQVVDREGIVALLWKPFSADAVAPEWVRRKALPPLDPNKITVTAFCNGWCTAQNLVYERAKRAVSDPVLAKKVVFREVNTFDRDEFRRWGISDALFINRKEVRTGPPPSYEKIRKLIHRQAKKVKSPIADHSA